MTEKIGVRELKNRLSACLREVAAGEVVLVTDRGRVVAEFRRPRAEALAGPAEHDPDIARGDDCRDDDRDKYQEAQVAHRRERRVTGRSARAGCAAESAGAGAA